MPIELTPGQITDLAKPLVGMVQIITDYFKDPQHEKAYREWYIKKYGKEPEKEV